MELDNVKDMKAPEHHSWSNILLESNHVPISAAKVTLLQAISIPLYPLSTISINTGPIYENLTMSQFLLQKWHFYRQYPSPHLSCKRKLSMSNIKKPPCIAWRLNKNKISNFLWTFFSILFHPTPSQCDIAKRLILTPILMDTLPFTQWQFYSFL